jgi:hypothetical protein
MEFCRLAAPTTKENKTAGWTEPTGGFGVKGIRQAPEGALRLLVRLGLAQADDFVTLLVLAAGLEDFDALETLQDVALGGDGALTFEAAMLRHRKGFGSVLL